MWAAHSDSYCTESTIWTGGAESNFTVGKSDKYYLSQSHHQTGVMNHAAT